MSKSGRGIAKQKMTWLIVLASVLVPIFLVVMQVDDWKRDWTTNHAALEASAENPDLRPQKLSGTVDEVADAIARWVDSNSAWNWESSRGGADRQTIQLTRTTRVFRFVDDVTVTLTAEDEPSVTLHAESQSRVGKGDLGQNPRNLIALVRGVRQQLGGEAR
jgi:hypothetical protein